MTADLRQLAAETPSAWTPVPQADGSVRIYAGARLLATVEAEFADTAAFLVFARRYFDAKTDRELKALWEVVLEAARITRSGDDEYRRKLLADFAGYIKHILAEGATP